MNKLLLLLFLLISFAVISCTTNTEKIEDKFAENFEENKESLAEETQTAETIDAILIDNDTYIEIGEMI